MGPYRASNPPFVGRRAELDALRDAFERASAGEPSTVFVAGEAGIGKTRTMREFVGQMPVPAHVMYGACVPPADAGLPYEPIREALRTFVRRRDAAKLDDLKAVVTPELASIVPELWDRSAVSTSPPESGYPQLRMFELFLNLLEYLADEQPVVLILEDLHCADASTLALVAFLIHNLSDTRILVCGTYRHDELHRRHPLKSWLAEQSRGERVARLTLPRFGRQEMADQIQAITGATPGPDVIENLMARSEGNPFLTEELTAALAESGRVELPGSLRELLLDRFLRLPDDAQSLLRVAAVASRAIRPMLLAKVANLAEDDLYRILRDAVDHHILVADQDGKTFSFRHALLQEAIYSEVLPGECQRLHARYAEELTALLNDGLPDGSEALPELAHHWDAANNAERALMATLDAAEWARSVFAFGSAQRYFERALELWSAVPAPDVDYAAVLFRAGQAAHFAGDLDRAIAILTAAVGAVDEEADPMRAALWHGELAWCHFQLNAHRKAEEAIGHALRLSARVPETPDRAGILALAGRLLMLLRRDAEARRSCEEAIELARRIGARREEGAALNPLGNILCSNGEFEEGIAALRKSLELAEEVDDVEAIAVAYINLGHVLGASGRQREKAEISRHGYEVVSRMGLQRGYGGFIRMNEAEAMFDLGQWDTARELLNEARRGSLVGMSEDFLTQLTARMDALQGVSESVEQHVAHLESRVGRGANPESTRLAYETITELWISINNLENARASMYEGLSSLSDTSEANLLAHLLTLGLRLEADRAWLARAQHSADAERDAIAAARALIDRAETLVSNPLDSVATPLPEVPAFARLAEAELARAEGRDDPDLWSAAAGLWEQSDRPHAVAYARWREADAILASGRPKEDAAGSLRTAHEIAVRLDARPLRDEIASLARRARISLETQHTESQSAAREGVEDSFGLSDRELEVLKLVADGLSNPQIGRALFISPKTASIHVSNILRKLGVSGRVEAAGVAHRLGLVRPGPPS